MAVVLWQQFKHYYYYAIYRIAGFFHGRKPSRILRFCGNSQKFSPRISIFKQLDTALVSVVHWVTANLRKFYLRKSIFKQFTKVFSRERNTLYSITNIKTNKTLSYFNKNVVVHTKLKPCDVIVGNSLQLVLV